MMEPIYFYCKETALDTNNKFRLDFSNIEMVYETNFSPKNDYYIATMNCNLIIANDYGDATQDIRDPSEKKMIIARNFQIQKEKVFKTS